MKKLVGLFLKTPEESSVFRRMARENFSIYRKDYAIVICCLLVIAATTAFSAWLMGPVVKDVFYGNDMNQAFVLALTVIGIFLVKGGLSYVQSVILERIGNNIVARYQRRVFDHLLNLDVGFFAKQHSAGLVARINGNIGGIRNMLNSVIMVFVRDLVTLIGLLGVMIYRDPIMSLAMLIIGPIALYTIARYARRVKRIAREEILLNVQVATAMQEASHGIAVVKAFTMEEQLKAKLNALTVEAENRSNKIARIMSRTSPLMETIAGFAIAAVIAYGGWRVINQGYEPSDLTSFMTALLLAYDPAKRLARMRVILERSIVHARMVYEILDTEPRHRNTDSTGPFQIEGGQIEFRNVTFRYNDGSQAKKGVKPIIMPPPVISSLSFQAEAGKTTALVGPSGGGKSTIISLIQRFYDPEGGSILVDGNDISATRTYTLRSNIAYVSQSPILFQGTVRENLRYARPDATDAEIEAAARSAQAHDFITSMPNGYDTPLEENGGNLSGGQRQRLSIARALVRDAPILLLDEATSALDNESEALVQQALDILMAGRTTIVIAHRLSTISNADKILVIDNGKVVDEGSHGELMARENSAYAKLQTVSQRRGNS